MKMKKITEQQYAKMVLTSSPVVAKTKKLSINWTFKEGRMIYANGLEEQYYECVDMSKDVTRYYARCCMDEWTKEEVTEVMEWLRKKLSDPKYTILREGSNFFDVIKTERLKEINGPKPTKTSN